MTAKKATRKPKVTREESKAAFNAQAPGTKKRKADAQPVVMDAASFAEHQKQYRDFKESNWINAENLEGQPFYIVRVWSFETTDFGSKVGFAIVFDPKDAANEDGVFSLSWSHDREAMAKAFKGMRKGAKSLAIGPMTIVPVPTSKGLNDYWKIQAYSDTIAQEYAEKSRTARKSKRNTTKGKATKAAKKTNTRAKSPSASKPGTSATAVKRLAAKHPGKKSGGGARTENDVPF